MDLKEIAVIELIDGAGNRPEHGDFLSAMRANAAGLRSIGDPGS